MTQDQIELRFDHWGGSDAARDSTGKFGGTAAAVSEKVLRVNSFTGNDATRLGDLAEPDIADFAAGEIGCTLDRGVWHADEADGSPIAVNCDAVTPDEEPVECKLVLPWSKHEWTDDEPNEYSTVQLHTQMLCLGAARGWVAAWLLGEGKRLYEVPRNEELCQAIRARASHLWTEYVLPKRLMDEAFDSDPDVILKALARIHREPGKTITLCNDHPAIKLLDVREQATAGAKILETVADAAKARIVYAMGDAERAVLPDGRVVEWNLVNVKANPHPKPKLASSHRRFNVKEPKPGTGMEVRVNDRTGSEYDA